MIILTQRGHVHLMGVYIIARRHTTRISRQGLVIHACYLSPWKTETRGSGVQDQPLHDRDFQASLSQKSQPSPHTHTQSSQIKGEHILQDGCRYHTEKGEAEWVGIASSWRSWHLAWDYEVPKVATSQEWWVTDRPRAAGGKWRREQRMRGQGAACWGARTKVSGLGGSLSRGGLHEGQIFPC